MENQTETKLVSQLSIERYEQLYYGFAFVAVAVSIKNIQPFRADAKYKRGLKFFPEIINQN